MEMSESKNEEFRSVKVLYDYNYTDTDNGEEVYMYVDEEFILLQETNDEWWEVYRPTDQTPFFVPAQYVTLIDSPTRTDVNCNEENEVRELEPEDEGEEDYVNISNNNVVETKIKDKPEVFYANLEEFRAAANIPEPNVDLDLPTPPVPPNKLNLEKESPSGDYANLAFIQSSIHPPAVEQGDFVEVLCPPLPWDTYKDRYSGRLFYHNRETDECMWKPPRKGKSPSSPPPEKLGEGHIIGEKKLGLPPEPKVRKSLTNDLFDEYDVKTENGEEIHINRISKDKFKKTEDGKYINVETGDKHSELPSNRNDKKVNFSKGDEKSNGEMVGTVTNKSFTSLPRSSKSTSLYGNDCAFKQNLEQHLAKSSTLPPNFSPDDKDTPLSIPAFNPTLPHSNLTDTTARPSSPGMVKSASSPSTTATSYRQEPNKPLCGYITTSKISEVGKKVKKNWGQAYLVLKQSNLVFYKDEKAANHKQSGSPHGKTELVLNLQGAKIDLNPRDITSKKNVILLAAANGSKFLLQSDEETIFRWFTEMKLVSGDIDNEKRPSSREDKKGSGMTRSMSAEDGSGGRKLWDIRSRLLGLMRSRPAQEDLVKRGIIKDLVFGSRLKDLCEKEHTKVPNFVRTCITAVEKRGLDHDGIYRVSGNLAEIQKLRYAVDKEEAYNLDDKTWDMNVLTGALKLFFRELKEPLIPPDLFERFASAVRKESYKDKLKCIKEILPDVPKCNYETMKLLFQHLTLVIKESKKNRMQAHNLAIVFGPTLSWKDDADASNMAVLTIFQSRIVEFMLMEFENLFK